MSEKAKPQPKQTLGGNSSLWLREPGNLFSNSYLVLLHAPGKGCQGQRYLFTLVPHGYVALHDVFERIIIILRPTL